MMNGKKKKQRGENMGSKLSNVRLTDNTKLIKNATDQQIGAALEAIGLKVEGYAKLICPVDTGRLRNSITHVVKTNEKTVYIGTNVKYAAAVECGTSRQRPQPYLKPAATQHTDEYKTIAEYYLTH